MKLQNKATGEIGKVYLADNGIEVVIKEAMWSKEYNSLAELNDEWEDYEEPLIKDEKIRKAIKVWAVANGFDRVFICRSFEVWGVRYDVGIGTTDILFRGEPPLEPGEQYSIEELCGGEE